MNSRSTLRSLAESTLQDLRSMNEKDSERVEQCRQEVDESLQRSAGRTQRDGRHAERHDRGGGAVGHRYRLGRARPSIPGSHQPAHRAMLSQIWTPSAHGSKCTLVMWPPAQQQPMRDSAPTPCRKSAKSLDSAKPKPLPEMWSCFDRGHDPTRRCSQELTF